VTAHGSCVECKRERGRETYDRYRADYKAKALAQRDPVKSRESAERYREENPERIRKTARKWYEKNREARRRYARELYQKNREEISLKRRASYAVNPEPILEMNRTWREQNKAKVKIKDSIKSHRRRAAEGEFTQADLDAIRKAQKDKCAYCRAKLRGCGHLDHIKAVSRGGSNWPRNLQWLCAPCNMKKHDKSPEDFARSLGRLI